MQTIISSLKKRYEITLKTHKKIKIIFKFHFLSSLMISINDIKENSYSLLTNDEKTMINRKLIKTVYKININKTLKVNNMINKALN